MYTLEKNCRNNGKNLIYYNFNGIYFEYFLIRWSNLQKGSKIMAPTSQFNRFLKVSIVFWLDQEKCSLVRKCLL